MSQARRLTGPKKYLAVVLAILFILLIWQAAAWSLPAFLMPGIPTVFERLFSTIQEPEFREGLYGSMSRLGSGYSFALLFGIGFGLVGGVLFFFREILRSAIVILQSIPSIAWVPLFLIVMGFGNLPIIVVVALAAFFPLPSWCDACVPASMKPLRSSTCPSSADRRSCRTLAFRPLP